MKKILYVYLTIIAIIVEMFMVYPLLGNIEVSSLEMITFYILSPILSFAISTLINLPFIILLKYIVEKYKYKKEEKQAKFNIEDITYFRDKLPGANPGILSLILNKKINYKMLLWQAFFAKIKKVFI